jgi:hypothetical protein
MTSPSKVEISGETFPALAQKLEQFSKGLNEQEQALLTTIMLAANKEISAADEVQAYYLSPSMASVSSVSGLRTGFQGSFGNLAATSTGVGSLANPSDARAIGVSVGVSI